MEKLRLDFYLSVGGELVVGDSFECGDLQKTITQVEHANRINHPGSRDAKIKLTSFAERENKGAQPVPDDFPVIVDYGRGLDDFHNKETGKTAKWRWVQLWKPDYEALLKMQAEHDKHNESIIKACDEANKKESEMIYTQEMANNGESPKIGMRCLDRKGNEVVFLGEHKAEAWLESVSNTIDWNTHCDAVKNLKPLKTPEQIKLEEAKKKQAVYYAEKYREAINDIDTSPRSLFELMQENGDLPEIVIDDLSARGMARG